MVLDVLLWAYDMTRIYHLLFYRAYQAVFVKLRFVGKLWFLYSTVTGEDLHMLHSYTS